MATQMGWAFLFAPTGAFTLEANVIFENYTKAESYIKTDPTAVAGKVISVTSGTEAGVYMIESVGENGSLKKVGSDVDLSNYVTKDQLSNIYTYKGSVSSFTELPSNANIGDVYNIEQAFTIGELESAQSYPAGTNVAWNGDLWDTLGGELDLSIYATKGEVSELNTNLTTLISGLTGDLQATNLLVSNKVDKVEGSSLITSEKLALIDINAAEIQALEDKNLDSRVSALEGMFKDGETNIDLSSITASISDHTSRIGTLESTTGTHTTDINGLKAQVSEHSTQLAAITELNTILEGRLSNLTSRLEVVEGYGTSITNLTTSVNKNSEDITKINAAISGLAVKSVKEGDKILAASESGELSTTINLAYDSENKQILLTGINGATVSTLDASTFIKDGMIDSVVYDSATKKMLITWNTDAGKLATEIDMTGLVDTYSAGPGLLLSDNNLFTVKLDESANNKLTLSDNGLLVDISADVTAINNSVDAKIASAFEWKEVN